MKIKLLAISIISLFPICSFAQGVLENPVAGGTESGIGVISGWHCTANNITVSIDGANLGKAGIGTSRNDTASVCGRTDTGFSLLYNYNDLTPGSHSINIYANGALFLTRQFNSVQSAGVPFATGLSSTRNLADFPSVGKTATLTWNQAKQGFVVTGISGGGAGGGGASVNTSLLQGSYDQSISVNNSGTQCSILGLYSGTTGASFNVTTNGNNLTAIGYTYTDTCEYNLSYASGDSTSGFNFKGSASCQSGLSSNSVTAILKRIGNILDGSLTIPFSGCTQKITL